MTLAQRIAYMFANSEQGAWYDPSGMSTMYQDAAGTTPVYMPGQGQVDPPVGLLLDKRLGLTRGPERFSDAAVTFAGESYRVSPGVYRSYSSAGAYNMINLSGDLTVGGWYELQFTIDSVAVVGSGIVLEGVTAQSSTIVFTTVGRKSIIINTAQNYVGLKRSGSACDYQISGVSIRALAGNHAYQTTTTSRPTLSARYNQLTNTESLATQSVAVAATTYTLTTAGPGSVTLSGAASGTYMAGSRMVTCTAGALTLTVLGSVTQADLRPANDGVSLPEYQRVVDANTYDATGFPLYLRFDGVDDALSTGNIDFTGTDKMTVWAGVRKLSYAATGILCELSAVATSNSGTFYISAPEAAGVNKFTLLSRGTVSSSAAVLSATYNAPVTAIVSGIGDISGDSAIIRVNGVQAASSTADQGTGTYGNYPLYIGRRGGTMFPFNGRIYQLIVRGAQSSLSQIEATEAYIKQKMRLP